METSKPLAIWTWLLPLTYLVHISEEYWGGEGFPEWMFKVLGVHMRTLDFLIMNGAGLAPMIASLVLVSRRTPWRWALTAIAGVVLLNGISHGIASTITRSYSPGLLTGMLIWVPLGLVILRREWRDTPKSTFRTGTLGALGMHALVCLLSVYG